MVQWYSLYHLTGFRCPTAICCVTPLYALVVALGVGVPLQQHASCATMPV